MREETLAGFYVNCSLLLADLTKSGISPECFLVKLFRIKYHENPFRGSRIVTCQQKDRHGEPDEHFWKVVATAPGIRT
jgi:hypothetical protein